MPSSHVEWTPAIVILVVGLVIGALIVWNLLSTRKKSKPLPDSIELRDLEGKRDALIQQLRDLDDDAAQLTPEFRASERRRLELEAASTLKAIDHLKHPKSAGAKKKRDRVERGHEPESEPPIAPAAAPAPAGSSATKGFLWGIGLAASIGLLIFFVSRVATERGSDGSLTGNLPENAQPAAATQPDAQLTSLIAAVNSNPDDMNARLELAFAYLVRENLMEVYNHTQYVLDRNPGNPRALAYQALVRLAMGQGDLAETMLKQALETEPNLLDARIHLALVYMQMGRQDEATQVMKEAMERHPEEKETLTTILAEIRASMTDPQSVPPQSQPAAPAGGGMGSMPAAPSSGAPGSTVSGSLAIDPAARGSLGPGAVLFLIARPAGVTSGPPVAAKRMPIGQFPMSFQLSSADSMMGQALPASIRIEAKVDVDGNPDTRGTNEPAASLDNVALGSTSVQLMLR